MSTLTASAAIAALLKGLTATTGILDSEGKVLGYFTPLPEKDRELYAWAIRNIDLDELKRREESGGPYFTTEQVIAHLNSLEPS